LTSLTYSSSTTDPEGDQIYYYFDWDDGTSSGWMGPYNSGQAVTASHVWLFTGSYNIKVQAKDTNGAISIWSDTLSTYMPRNKQSTNPFILQLFEQLMERFPRLVRLLQVLLQYPIFNRLLNIQ
jgi:hypothetical protein